MHGATDGAEDDGTWFQFDFEGLAETLASPFNLGGTRLAGVVDEHDGLVEFFVLAECVAFFREIIFGACDKGACFAVPAEESFSERSRQPAFRHCLPVDELFWNGAQAVWEEAWLLDDGEVVEIDGMLRAFRGFP